MATSSSPGTVPQVHFCAAAISSRAILTSAKSSSSIVVLAPGRRLTTSSGDGREIAFDSIPFGQPHCQRCCCHHCRISYPPGQSTFPSVVHYLNMNWIMASPVCLCRHISPLQGGSSRVNCTPNQASSCWPAPPPSSLSLSLSPNSPPHGIRCLISRGGVDDSQSYGCLDSLFRNPLRKKQGKKQKNKNKNKNKPPSPQWEPRSRRHLG